MANYREQPLSKGDYHNRVPNPNYHKSIKQVYNEDHKDLENYPQIPKKQQSYLETEVQDINNRKYYQGNSKNDDPFSNNPYYNRAALDQVCSRSIITYQDQPNKPQEDFKNNELQRDNQNQINQQQQNEPISKYYNNDQRDRYQEVKNYYYNQNHQYNSILSPKLYSQDNLNQQQEQQKQTQNKQLINQQQIYQKQNEVIQENPSFGQIQDYKLPQRQQQYQNQQIQQQLTYSHQESQEFNTQNRQKCIQNSTRKQVNNMNEHYSQRDVQQQRQCVSYQTPSPQQFHQDLPIQKKQQYHQRLQYLEELKNRIPQDDICYQQVDKRMPQTEQYYRQEQNERITKINPIAAVSRMQRPNDFDQDEHYHQSKQHYQNQKREDYLIQSNRNNSNQYQNLNKQYNDHENGQNQSYQRNNQNQKTRTPNRNREDSYERERQQFIQYTSHIKTNSQTINKRK